MLGTVTHHPGSFVTYHSGSNLSLRFEPITPVRTDSLTTTNWSTVGTNAGNGALELLTDRTAAAAQRFYRVRQW